MKQILKHIWLFFLFGLILVGSARPVQAQENLLDNPGFEGGFSAWNGIPQVQVAPNWTPWWIEDIDHNPRWHRPEWKRADGGIYPDRVRSGSSAQQYFTFYASHYAGMYQQVFDVTPGQRYQFSVWVQVWSSNEDNADTSVLPANPRLQIGIEPNGVARPGFASPPSSTVWSGEASMSQVVDGWGLMMVEAEAQNDVITVYLRSTPDFANKHNDIYLDDAALVAVNAPPPPQPTLVPPTNTPAGQSQPTATAAATNAPTTAPTETAIPATNTPELTATAEPTAIEATPTATETPEPTETATPEPTETPESTETPEPTAEPTATNTVTPSPTATNAAMTAEAESTEIAAVDEDESGRDPVINQPEQPTETDSVPPSSNNGTVTTLAIALGVVTALAGVLLFLLLRSRDVI